MIKLNTFFLLLSLSILLLSSCSDYENNIYINEDGSGKVTMRYDASEMMAMAEMMGGMGEGAEENNGDEDNDLNSLMKGLGNPSTMKDIDSTFTFYEVMPDSIKQTLKNPEILKNVSMTVSAMKADMNAIMGMDMKYNSLEQLDDIFASLEELSNSDDENQMSNFKELIRNYSADLKNGTVTLPEQDFSGDFGGDIGGQGIDFDNMSEEEAGMMQMMLGTSAYVTTLHLPGKVISCDDPDATIEGNTIVIRDDYMTLMKDKKMKARTVKYKVK